MLTLTAAAPMLGCRDPRTARKRLAGLGVPVVVLGGRVLVEEAEIRRALRAAARPLDSDAIYPRAGGVTLPKGARLWDGPPTNQVAGRRVNAPGRGERDGNPGRDQSLPGSVDRSAPRSSLQRKGGRDEQVDRD